MRLEAAPLGVTGPAILARPPIIRRRPIETETVTPLRRRQVSMRRKPRLKRWARRLAWLLAIVATPAATAGWLLTSERFALGETTVEIGTLGADRPQEIRSAASPPGGPGGKTTAPSRVSETWVRREIEPFRGHNLLRLSLAAVAESIERHPWVRSVAVGKELPGKLRVRVIERREAALLRHGDALREEDEPPRLTYLDGEGRPIAPVAAADVAAVIESGELVVVRRRVPRPETVGVPGVPTEADAELGAALDLLRELKAASPRWLAGLSEIEILGEQDFKVISTDLPFPLVVQAGTVEARIRRLEDHLPRLAERYGSEAVIDLRFARRIIVEPSFRGPAYRGPAYRGPAAAASAAGDRGGTQQKGNSG